MMEQVNGSLPKLRIHQPIEMLQQTLSDLGRLTGRHYMIGVCIHIFNLFKESLYQKKHLQACAKEQLLLEDCFASAASRTNSLVQ